MGFKIEGLVAEKTLLEKIVEGLSTPKIVDLADGLFIIPLTRALKDEAAGEPAFEGLSIPEPLAEKAKAASENGAVGYIEGDYPQSCNHQGAVLWTKGALSFGPEIDDTAWDPRETNEDRPVNKVFRTLGLSAAGFDDEWDAAGLTRHHDTEEWVS